VSPVGRTWDWFALIALAAIGGALLAVIVAIFWQGPNDDLAYWLAAQRLVAGQPVYVTGEAAFEPYAYHYTPPLAQVLAPLTLVLPTVAYLVGYRISELLAVWFIAGRRILPMLALIAFIPVAVELRFENVHLLMAVAVVLALSRWPVLFAVAAIVKISPGLGIVYLLLRRRWRDAAISVAVGLGICAISYLVAPGLWQEFVTSIGDRAGITGNSLIPVPYVVRAFAGLLIAVAGGLVGRRNGELLLVLGITVANPNLALNGFAVLAAAVPVWRAGPDGLLERRPAAD
jgi:Glycosyltransferase family 87